MCAWRGKCASADGPWTPSESWEILQERLGGNRQWDLGGSGEEYGGGRAKRVELKPLTRGRAGSWLKNREGHEKPAHPSWLHPKGKETVLKGGRDTKSQVRK